MEAIGVRVEIATLSPTVSLSDALDSAAQRGLLYCVIITSQHEIHRSVTLTILHGRNPQGELPLGCGLIVVIKKKNVALYLGLPMLFKEIRT